MAEAAGAGAAAQVARGVKVAVAAASAADKAAVAAGTRRTRCRGPDSRCRSTRCTTLHSWTRLPPMQRVKQLVVR